jgi:hypothetical protein
MLCGAFVSIVVTFISGQVDARELGSVAVLLSSCVLLHPLMDQKTERVFGPDLLCGRAYAGIILLAISIAIELARSAR